MTKGLRSRALQIKTRQCESVQSIPIAVGEGFYPSRAERTTKITRTLGASVPCRRGFSYSQLPTAGRGRTPPLQQVGEFLRDRRGAYILLLRTAQSLSRLRRQLPLHKGAFGAFVLAVVHAKFVSAPRAGEASPAPTLRRNNYPLPFTRLLARAPGGAAIRSGAENCSRRDSFPPVRNPISTK